MTEDEAKELYGQFGLTAYHGQCVEMEAGTLLLTFISVGNRITREEAMSAIDASIERQTFGALLRTIKDVVDFGDTALTAVDDALKKRNHLVHHFFRVHASDMLTPQGRRKMIEELEEFRRSFQKADTILHSITLAILKTMGLSEGEIQDAVNVEMIKNNPNKSTEPTDVSAPR